MSHYYSPLDNVVSRQVQEELDRTPDHFARMAAIYDAQNQTREVHAECDKHGEWTATPEGYVPGVDAVGRGETREEAIQHLREQQ